MFGAEFKCGMHTSLQLYIARLILYMQLGSQHGLYLDNPVVLGYGIISTDRFGNCKILFKLLVY